MTEKGPPIFHDLKKVLITDISDGKLMEEYSVFKRYFVKAAEEVSGLNHQLTLCIVIKHLLLWRRCSKLAPDYEEAGTQDRYGFNQRSIMRKLRLQDISISSVRPDRKF